MEVVEHHTFRVTRNADLEIDDRADDLLEALEEELTRRRFSPAVRLEVEQTMPHHVLELLMTELEVERTTSSCCRRRSTSPGSGDCTRSIART